jgi:Ca-activated chloride channel family protein
VVLGADDLARVAIRYQTVGSANDAPALEVASALPSSAVGTNLGAADRDLRWAAAIAAFAEILKGSPFADRTALPLIESIAAEQAGRDADRTEFASLVARAKPLLATP